MGGRERRREREKKGKTENDKPNGERRVFSVVGTTSL